jgi:hypothetical protein
MSREGSIKKIPIAGIERNVAYSTSGAMEELSGVSLNSDGRLILGSTLREDTFLSSLRLHDYSVAYVHPISPDISYLIVYSNQDNAVYTLAKKENGEWKKLRKTPILNNAKDVYKIIHCGKILIVCGEKVFYVKHLDNDIYRRVNLSDEDNAQLLSPYIRLYFSLKEKKTLFPIEGAADKIQEDTARIGFTKILKKEKQRGLIKGFVRVKYAFKLYDGSYIFYSNPTFLRQPNDMGTRYRTDFNGNSLPYNIDYEKKQRGFFHSTMCAISSPEPDGKKLQFKYLSQYVNEEKDDIDDMYYYPDNGGWLFDQDYVCAGDIIDFFQNGVRLFDFYPNLMCNRSTSNKVATPYTAVSVGGQLTCTFNGEIPSEFKDIITGVGIFMTDEVYGYHINKPTVKQHATQKGFGTMCEYFQIKNDAEVKKELEDTDIYYKVADINISEIRGYGIKEIDLKGKLDAIRTLTSATTEDRGDIIKGTTELYNGRLHVGGGVKKPFVGFPINYFQDTSFSGKKSFYVEDIMRYANKWEEMMRKDKPFIVLAVGIRVNNKIQEIKRYVDVKYLLDNNINVYTVPTMQMLSYPDARAEYLTIKINMVKDGEYYRGSQTFKLKSSDYNNEAYYLPDDLRPFVFSGSFGGQVSIDDLYDKEENNVLIEDSGNIMYVSEVNNPMLFLPKNKYAVGNGLIMDICTQSYEHSSQGSTGYSPLVVFSSDGIYIISVDTSLKVAYSNSLYLSTKKIMSPNSAYKSSVGILFAADKKLCLLSNNNIRVIDEKVQGGLCKLSDIPKVADLLESEQTIGMSLSPNGTYSRVPFSSYLNNARFFENTSRGEIIVWKKGYDYYYVLNNGRWFTGEGKVRYCFVEDNKPYCVVGNSCFSFRASPSDVHTKGFFVSKPIGNDNQFGRLTRAVIRGKFNVEDIVLANNIIASPKDMKVKVNNIRVEKRKYREVKFEFDHREVIDIPLPDIDYKQVEVNLTARTALNITYKNNMSLYNGYLFFEQEKWQQFVDAKGAISYKGFYYATSTSPDAPNGGLIETPISIWYTNKTSGVALLYKDLWLMPDYSIVNSKGLKTSYKGITDWRYLDLSGGQIAVLPKYVIIEEKSRVVGNYAFGTDYDWQHQRADMSPDKVTLSANTAYRFVVHPPYHQFGQGFVVKNKDFNSYFWDDFLFKVKNDFFGDEDVGYVDFNIDVVRGPHRFLGRKLDYPFLYTGEQIYMLYSELYSNLKKGVYPLWHYAQFEPNSINVDEGENILLDGKYMASNQPYEETPYFFTAAHKGVYNISDIVNQNISEYVFTGKKAKDKAGNYGESYRLILTNGEYYRLVVSGGITAKNGDVLDGVYEFKCTDSYVYSALTDVVRKIQTGIYPSGIPKYSPEYTFSLVKGASRFVDLQLLEYLFVCPYDMVVTYDELMRLIPTFSKIKNLKKYACIYVYGSTDGYKWQLLGRNERNGEFVDIGCLVERVDCKYFRVVFCGELNNQSFMEYIELQGSGTIFNEKMR